MDQVRAGQVAPRAGILALRKLQRQFNSTRGHFWRAGGIAGNEQGAAQGDEVRGQQAFCLGIARVSRENALGQFDGTVVTGDGFGHASHVGAEGLPLDGADFRICALARSCCRLDRWRPRGPAY